MAFEYAKTEYQKRLDSFARIALKVPLRSSDGGATTSRSALGITRR